MCQVNGSCPGHGTQLPSHALCLKKQGSTQWEKVCVLVELLQSVFYESKSKTNKLDSRDSPFEYTELEC